MLMDLFSTLETLAETLMRKSESSSTPEAKLAYEDSSNLLLAEITRIKDEIKTNEEMKAATQMAKFDVDHMNYDAILKKGYIGIPSQYHKELSSFSLGTKNATEVFNDLTEDFKFGILSTLTADKGMNEQLTAYRHNFHYIKHTKGHDGIRPDGKVFEVKNRQYNERKERMAAVIKFDRVSAPNARKLREGKPEIIFNITDNHKVLVEMKIAFSDSMLALYDKKVEELKYSKTSGFDIAFKDFKDHVIAITHVDPDLYNYNIQKNFLEFVASKS